MGVMPVLLYVDVSIPSTLSIWLSKVDVSIPPRLSTWLSNVDVSIHSTVSRAYLAK